MLLLLPRKDQALDEVQNAPSKIWWVSAACFFPGHRAADREIINTDEITPRNLPEIARHHG